MALPRATLVIALAASVAPTGAFAVGFGRVTPSGVLGQPLSLTVPIRLDQGEQLYAECIHAEVVSGESTLASSQVRVSVTPTANPAEWNARITTTVPLLEPVVEVAVSAGCERRFMRRFTTLLDPPLMSLSTPVLAGAGAGTSERALPADPAMASSRASGRRSVDSVVRRERSTPPPRRADPPASRATAKASSRAVPATTPPTPALSSESGERQVSRLLLDVGSGPRLRMDIEDPVFMPAGSASAASGVAESLDSETERLRLLEKTLADLKREASAYHRTETGLKARLAESEGRSRLVPWLVGLLVLAGGLVGWLLWRQRSQGTPERADAGASVLPEGKAEAPWWGTDGAVAAAAPVAAAPAVAEVDDNEHTGARVVAEFDTPSAAYERTQPFTAPMAVDAQSSVVDGQAPAREVSVEELLDLEQQADFFIALGQEDAAVDLLMSHLRGTGGQSPLPYTKLLEIYRRQGDRTAYERIRARFNRRFNAYAPDWDQGPQHGRTLEEYPEVVSRLQGLWSSPLNAMAVLEAMLFRNDELQELFDLPAYKDVLLLYSLARDLYQQEGVTAADVDLLLPIGDESAFSAGTATPPANGGADSADKAASRDNAYDLTSFNLELQPTEPRPADKP